MYFLWKVASKKIIVSYIIPRVFIQSIDVFSDKL